MQIIPAIDLRGGSCVRLSQGRKSEVTTYDEDPVEVARQFAHAGATMIHVVDLDRAFGETDSPNRRVLKSILENVDTPVEFGGGVRTIEDARLLSELGVSRIVLGTIACESPNITAMMVEELGPKICVGIDARDGKVMTRGWESNSGQDAIELAQQVARLGVGRIVYTDISRDGMLTGPNVPQTVSVARAAQVRITASGGVGSLDDLKSLRDSGEPLIDSVIVGKALYEGAFQLEEAITLLN